MKEYIILKGGRGAGSGIDEKTGSGGITTEHNPSEINRIRKTGTQENITKHFRDLHSNDDHEWAIAYDDNGYVYNYNEGDKGSVRISASDRAKNITHNHPIGNEKEGLAWGNFSGWKGDVGVWTRSPNTKTIKAESKIDPLNRVKNRKAGTYTLTKGGHFDAKGFEKSFRDFYTKRANAENYDASMSAFLRNGQKKYGYKFSYKPTKEVAELKAPKGKNKKA